MSPRAHSSTTAACSASGRRCRAPCWRTSTSCSETHGCLACRSRRARRRHRSGKLHEHADRSRSRAGSRARARAAGRRRLDPGGARRVRGKASTRSSTLAAARSSSSARACSPRSTSSWIRGRRSSGAGRSGIGRALEDKGAHVPADDDEIHLPHARLHAALASEFLPAEEVAPLYVRSPDAKVRSPA